MKHLFKSTPSSLFAALTLAGIVSSGYIAFDAAGPILKFLPQISASSILSSLPTPSPRALVAGVSSATQQVDQAVSSLKSQLASLSSQVSALQAVQEDMVLGSSTVLGEQDQVEESVPVREEFPPAVNLLRNSSFEEDSDGAPRQWQYQYDSTSGNTKTSAEAYRSGSKGLKVVGGGSGNYGVSQPVSKMIERRDYAFSIWVKPVNTDSHTIKLSFWDEVANKEAAAKTFSFSSTKEWSRIVFQISNKNGWNGKKWFPMITVNGLGSGALYLDDAQLEEASSYTPYHFTGGGATQSFVSVLGDGAVEVDAHGNVYPAVNGIGSVGTGDNKFSELKLSKATINKDGDLDIQGSLTINGNTTLKGTVGFTARFNTHLLPDQTNTYDLGSTTYLWRDLYVDGVGYIDAISSRSNANLQITVGTGTLNLSAATARLTGNLIVTGTETKNGVAYTFPGSDGSANTILTTNGSGILTWTTAGASGITADSLDFTEFDDSLDLDADTSINGALSFIIRTGNGARQNATSGSNDLQLAAEDAMLLDAGDFTLAASENAVSAIALNASRGGILLSSSSAGGNGNITLRAAGTLTLDTSANNTNVIANTGTGRLVATSNNAGITALQLLATNGGIDLSTSGLGGVGELRLRSGGSLKLDTSGNNNNILVDSGTGDLISNIGTETLVAQDDAVNAVSLSASRGGINLSSSSASGSGDIKIRAAGTLHLDTSASASLGGANILANTGTGRLVVTSGGTGTGSTAAISLLATNGGIDVSTSGAGGNGNLTLRSAGTLVLDTSASDTDINVLAGNNTSTSLTLRSDRGGIDISSSAANGSGDIRIRAGGTLRLDTSVNNSNIMLRAGTGRIDVSGNTIVINSGAGTLDLSANSTINVVSSTNATLFGETGTFLGRAGQITTVYGRMCIRGSDGGTACPAGSDGRLFVQVTGEVVDDPGDVFADVAEYYPASEPVDAGTVVIADASARATVKMSQYPYQKVLGVVSTNPAVMINEGSFEVGGGTRSVDPMKPLVALVGRVPVKVSNQNGPIRVGDRLVASSTPGYAMKATKQGMTLGMALEDQDFADGSSAKVMTFVNVSWYFPEVIAELEREYAVSQALGSAPDVSTALTAAVESSETVTPGTGLAQTSNTTGSVLGTADATATTTELAVAIPPTEFPNISVTGALTVGKELIVKGTSRFEGEVTVLADASFQKSVIIVGNLRVGGNLDVVGAVTTPLVAGSAVSAGDPVSVSGDGTVSRSSGGRAVVGVAANSAASGSTVHVAVAGRVGGMSGLSAGSRYFVSGTGTLTTDGAGGQAIGVAVSASELLVQPGVGLPGVVAAPATSTEPAIEPVPVVVNSTEPSSSTVQGATTVVLPSPTPTPVTPLDTSSAPVVTAPVVETAVVTPTPEAPSPTPAP